ncbi:molybdenum cofactor guanylyltransferase MobA [Rhizobiales bacterium]|uniref:molybdenum cofactor guanylyltransferase MobA n=1 Tax=Hongsoonwoonella zoysiae TaxID=2821844 RepID=UPI001560967D|nr:molybdenum cofactor guanylyltransferase MobA [Hongsoonwoonella zoysiae]NRG18345.1 molybdenum cofactor guanylyltransferase MobA [Hongsoonwoonella zoysiae]
MTSPAPNVVGCVLAGGLARRMGGGDKTLKKLAGRPMLAHVIERLSPQVRRVMLNANGDPDRFSHFGLPVEADPVEGFAGPLAGVLAGLEWVKANEPDAEFVVSVAGDTPFFPGDLVTRLLSSGLSPRDIVLARSDEGMHPVFGLWPVSVTDDLRDFLENGETRKVLAFVDRHPNRSARFDAVSTETDTFDPFFNINTPEELEIAEALYRGKAA